jgi:hypothetical protein
MPDIGGSNHEQDQEDPSPISEDGLHVQLTYSHLDINKIIQLVKRPDAGAIVTFTGEDPLTYACELSVF